MNCPNCQALMLPAKTVSKYGANVFIDQCPQCGGMWFDGDELYLATHQDSDNYIDLDESKLLKKSAIKNDLICPRDGSVLKAFSDPYFPKELDVEHCGSCGGFWFNHGEFAAFQDEREKNTRKNDLAKAEKTEIDPELKKKIDSLLNAEKIYSKDAIVNLGRFLSQPVNHGGNFITGPNFTGKGVSEIGQLIWLILKIFIK